MWYTLRTGRGNRIPEHNKMKKTALVLLADGCEEIEAITIVDVLRRGGVEVTTAALKAETLVRGAHGIDFHADTTLAEADASAFDLTACPGGMGCMRALRDTPAAREALRSAAGARRFVAAVCASPVALGAAGLLAGRRFCCYPGMEGQISGGTYVADAVTVRDGNVITGTGPATALPFALALLEALAGKETSGSVAAAMLA